VTPADDAADEVEQGEVVGGLLGPADQDGAEAVEPGVYAFDDPAPRFGPGMRLGPGFLATAAQMQGEAKLCGEGTRRVIVKPLVETEMLGLTACRSGPSHRDGLQGLAHQLMVVAIGAADHHPERETAAVGQQRAFDPALTAIRGIAAGFPPHPAAPCPPELVEGAPSNASQLHSIPFRAS
jgi:hypothetical protein